MGAVAAVGILAAGCGNDRGGTSVAPEKPYPYHPPAEIIDATNVWSSEPGVDLLGEQGLLARAAVESEFIKNATLRVQETYWGFGEALAKDDGRNVGHALSKNLEQASLVGTLNWRLMSLIPKDNGFEAFACMQLRGAAAKFPVIYAPNEVHYVTWTVGSIQSTRVTFSPKKRGQKPQPVARQTAPASPEEPNARHWQGPSVNLFKGWQLNITNSDPADANRCEAWGYTLFPPPSQADKELAEQNRPLGAGFHSVRVARPETLPSYPGWPE
ncbi:hypothetical protein NDR87_24690 [Nocardia sp. CDC159]|uniref:Uncharacterized protein n=1 Tax=Nocardia pulmonis TaxID=2951408 RepID=A0A9X2E7M3_9NOCA|nr:MULTISPECIES: hypothetical protein [Nocardia]MCM6775101.1 hypothetical protein [Nocardia pulmonis]MCM6789571.1 hypothetical protein [Nocardia sp. CDC159]